MTFNRKKNMIIENQYDPGLISPTSAIIYDCSVCSIPICDQIVFRVDGKYFHTSCLKCSECHMKLHNKCYARNGITYCKEHFFKKFGTKCSSCDYGISATDAVRRANNFVYHLQCFTCLICHRQLKTGDQFYLIDDQKLVCKNDYDTLKDKELENANKRPRSIISQEQLEILKRNYNISVKPPRYVRESLATKTGLDMRVVQVWFQNRRAKEKRLKGDSNRQRKNAMRNGQIKEHKTKRQNIIEQVVLSDESDCSTPENEVPEPDPDDSLSHNGPNNSIYSGVHQPSRGESSFTPYVELKGLLVASAYPPISSFMSKCPLSPSSISTITIHDDHESSSESDIITLRSIRNDKNPKVVVRQ